MARRTYHYLLRAICSESIYAHNWRNGREYSDCTELHAG
jgi:hypothetical protein